jgi:hypothetical protein
VIVTELRSPFFVTDAEVDAWLAYEASFEYVRETQPNCGPEVEIFQRFCGGQRGDSWCDDFQCFCYCGVWPHIPLTKSGRCQTTRERASALGWLLPRGTAPQRGDIGLCIDVPKNHAHHIFSVTSEPTAAGVFHSTEGNTNPAGGSNGYGVFSRKSRSMKLTTTYEFIRFPRRPNG